MTITRSTHPGTVVSTDDPEQRGRIKVTVPSIMGEDETALPMWVPPALTWGFFAIPDVGEEVEIDIAESATLDEGFGQTSVEALDPVWRGTRIYDVGADNPKAPINADFKENYGKRRGIQTPRGHTLVFDDTEGSEAIQINWRAGLTGKRRSITITETQVVIAFDGAVEQSVAIAEPLQALWGLMKSVAENAHNTQVHPSAMGPTGVPAVPLTLPSWDEMINSAKVKLPGNSGGA